MTVNYTPGPWKCVPTSHHYHDYRIFTPIGLIPFERGSGVEYANAKLISAAPELLEALQFLVECSAPMTGQQEQCWISIRAAIAKATIAEVSQ